MRLQTYNAPHIRSSVSNRTVMGDAVVTLGAIYTMTYFYYGLRALVLGALSVAVCVLSDAFCCWLRGRRVHITDLSPVVTGLLIPLLMPATIPYRMVIVSALFAILVVKQPFGGVGNNPFNPAAAAFAFAIVCWSKELFAYPMPFAPIPLTGAATVPLYSSAAYTLYVGGVPRVPSASLILGLSPGPMGTTNLLVLLACMLYLVLRRTVRFQQPLLMLAVVAGVAWFFPRTGTGPWGSVFFELTAMPTVFFAAFMFTDPVTTPTRSVAKALYAVASGFVLMAFRYFGGYELTEPFALLLMNATMPLFDLVVEEVNTMGRRMVFGTKKIQAQSDFDGEETEE